MRRRQRAPNRTDGADNVNHLVAADFPLVYNSPRDWLPIFGPDFMSVIARLSLIALLLIWIGYPLTVAALSRLRRRKSAPSATNSETVSVILATRAPHDLIRTRLRNLFEVSYDRDRIEFVVGIDSARGEASVDQVSTLDARVHAVVGDAPGGKAATLNAAVRAARNDILVFADTAQSFKPEAVSELVRALREPNVGAVSGMLELPATRRSTMADQYWRYERRVRSVEARLHSAIGVTGAIYAMRRDLWRPLPAELILDDLFTPMRLVLEGWRIGFSERARATDDREFAPAQEYRRKVRTLTGVIQVCAWAPRVLNPFANPVWIQFVFHKLLRLLTPYLVAVLAIDLCWELGQKAFSADAKLPMIGIAAVLTLVVLLPRLRRAVATQIHWGVSIQTSIVVATINGLRGRWDVWRS